MDTSLDITSTNPNLFLFHSTMPDPDKLISVSGFLYESSYDITTDYIEYSPLPSPSPPSSPILNANMPVNIQINDNHVENKTEVIEEKNQIKTIDELLLMKTKDLNQYIKTNNLNLREIHKLKQKRRRALNCIYARNCRSKKVKLN